MLFRKFLRAEILCVLALIGFNSVAVNAAGGGDVPTWATQAAARQAPGYEKDVPAVVLHTEQIVNVAANNQVTTTTRYAMRALNRDGKYFASGYAFYLQSASKVREMRAWLIRPNGTVKVYDKDQIVDKISDPDDIYDEGRVKEVDAEDDMEPNAVFAYETTVEESNPLFLQEDVDMQNCSPRFCFPALVSRYTLNVPAGWQVTSKTLNRAEVKPTVSGSSYVWELQNLAPIPPEPDSPAVHTLAPRILINYSSGAQKFNSWTDVSQWYTDFSESSLTVDDAVAGKARELTANATTELEKIRAVANYVQNMRYISLQLNRARGGGHRPRPANLVLQRGFGDCKDKANLMRAMLKALKIESYLVLIYAGDPSYVRAEWASPRQFNHCIIAVKVGDQTKTPTVIQHETLGRLLLFDATDDNTLVGDFPDHEQGSFALVAAGANGKLMQMPILPPEANRLERSAEAALLPDGSLQGAIREQAFGQSATHYRRESRGLSAIDYQKRMEAWLNNRLTGAKMAKLAPKDRQSEGRFDLDLEFAAGNYAQVMQGRLMMFKPAFVGRLDQFAVTKDKRIHPLMLDASAYSETIKVKLPEGFAVDEMPEGNTFIAPFGKYTVSYEVKDGFLLFNRQLTLNKTTVAAEQFDSVKDFFAKVRSSEQSPVVLIKK